MVDAATTTDSLRMVPSERPRQPLPTDVPAGARRATVPLPDDAPFALCLTHDLDRPYKGLRALYYAAQERPAYHLQTLRPDSNPYWQFDEIRRLEAELGVRSAFYVLNEQHLLADRPPRDWLSPTNWVQHLGRYDVTDPTLGETLRGLVEGGWEVGLHGSSHTADDRERLLTEKATLERVVGEPVVGGRQHYLQLSVPQTWRHHRAIGLRYDASFGSGTDCGFQYGYRPFYPFDDAFLVFPLTIMEQALPDPGIRFREARAVCASLLEEAIANEAVMTVLWHPRYFNEREFPGYRRCYRWLIERATEVGGWVGTPRALAVELAGTASTVNVDDSPEVEPSGAPSQESAESTTG